MQALRKEAKFPRLVTYFSLLDYFCIWYYYIERRRNGLFNVVTYICLRCCTRPIYSCNYLFHMHFCMNILHIHCVNCRVATGNQKCLLIINPQSFLSIMHVHTLIWLVSWLGNLMFNGRTCAKLKLYQTCRRGIEKSGSVFHSHTV